MDNTRKRHNYVRAITMSLLCIGVNLFLNNIVGKYGLPVYLDAVGTVFAALLGGYVPGIFVAHMTNVLEATYNTSAIYYGILNVIIALFTTYLSKRKVLKKIPGIACYTLIIAVIGGIIGGMITWFVYGYSDSGFAGTIAKALVGAGINKVVAFVISQFVIDIFDKVITVVFVFTLVHFLPNKFRRSLYFVGWKQRPLTRREIIKVKEVNRETNSIGTKVAIIVTTACVLITVTSTLVSIFLFKGYSRSQHSFLAEGIAEHASDVIDAEKVNEYIEKGEDADGYKETAEMLASIKKSSPDIAYVYVYQIREDGCHVVFDVDTEAIEGSNPGDVVEFDESFEPYLDDLLAGKAIKPIISNDSYGWLLTVYRPVYNAAGECVCYIGVDVSMNDLEKYDRQFLIKLVILIFGFLVLVIAISMWISKYHLLYPLNSIAYASKEFAYNSDSERREHMNYLSELDIKTNDEVENMYSTVCKMTSDIINYIDDVNEKNELILSQQSSLIMLLADMVENRDESTGDHVRKTAAYTRIIMEELKREGHYTDQLTDEFIDDVFKSAPLHDIGKISISDTILNKPGKLTDDEFEIMKTHTTAGAKILEQAMETMPDSKYLKEAKNLAEFHHEKWNGRGYPYGLVGEDIPLSARIMAVADVFDALVSKRIYKDAFPFEKAMNIIKEDAGTHFDPLVAQAFLNAQDEVRRVAESFNLRKNGIKS